MVFQRALGFAFLAAPASGFSLSLCSLLLLMTTCQTLSVRILRGHFCGRATPKKDGRDRLQATLLSLQQCLQELSCSEWNFSAGSLVPTRPCTASAVCSSTVYTQALLSSPITFPCGRVEHPLLHLLGVNKVSLGLWNPSRRPHPAPCSLQAIPCMQVEPPATCPVRDSQKRRAGTPSARLPRAALQGETSLDDRSKAWQELTDLFLRIVAWCSMQLDVFCRTAAFFILLSTANLFVGTCPLRRQHKKRNAVHLRVRGLLRGASIVWDFCIVAHLLPVAHAGKICKKPSRAVDEPEASHGATGRAVEVPQQPLHGGYDGSHSPPPPGGFPTGIRPVELFSQDVKFAVGLYEFQRPAYFFSVWSSEAQDEDELTALVLEEQVASAGQFQAIPVWPQPRGGAAAYIVTEPSEMPCPHSGVCRPYHFLC